MTLRGPIIDDSLLNHKQGTMQNGTKMHHLRTAEQLKWISYITRIENNVRIQMLTFRSASNKRLVRKLPSLVDNCYKT